MLIGSWQLEFTDELIPLMHFPVYSHDCLIVNQRGYLCKQVSVAHSVPYTCQAMDSPLCSDVFTFRVIPWPLNPDPAQG
jgi:hypothetical protein